MSTILAELDEAPRTPYRPVPPTTIQETGLVPESVDDLLLKFLPVEESIRAD